MPLITDRKVPQTPGQGKDAGDTRVCQSGAGVVQSY